MSLFFVLALVSAFAMYSSWAVKMQLETGTVPSRFKNRPPITREGHPSEYWSSVFTFLAIAVFSWAVFVKIVIVSF